MENYISCAIIILLYQIITILSFFNNKNNKGDWDLWQIKKRNI